jgi:cytochrome P450
MSMSREKRRPPVVGTLAEYSDAPFARRTEWAQQGDLVRITGPDADHHMAVHPDHVEEVLFDQERFDKFEGYESVFGRGVVSVYGDQWRAQRGAMQPAFVPQKVREYVTQMRGIVRGVADGLEPGETFDARAVFSDITMEVMLQTLFGGAEGKETVSSSAERITEWFLESATTGEVPPEVQKGYDTGLSELTELINEMVAERDGREDGDLLSMLIALGADSEAGYTEERIRDEMITMLFAAHETTALTLTYTLSLLADSPSVERRLQAELDAVLDGELPTADALEELEYTEQVIDEALRMYCPAHALFRETTEDVGLDGYTIPEGDVVQLPQWVIHRDERWWDDPDEFHPERFADGGHRSYAFFPFGVGPRRCLGEDFARAESKLVVATLCDRFSFDRVTEEFEMHASLTAVPDRPVKLVCENRR